MTAMSSPLTIASSLNHMVWPYYEQGTMWVQVHWFPRTDDWMAVAPCGQKLHARDMAREADMPLRHTRNPHCA